jgi:tetratricopeptide (TPR) repeat protein
MRSNQLKTTIFAFFALSVIICRATDNVWAFDDREQKALGLASYTMGVVYDFHGLTNRAIEEFKKASQYEDSYAIHLRLGADYARIGDLPQAIKELNQVLELDANNVQARYLLALIYSTQKDFDKAAQEYESILTSFSKAEPENIEIYGYLGQLYYSQKQYQQAIKQYEIILSLDSSDEDILFILGSLYLEIDDRTKAIELFDRAIKINPQYDIALNSLGYMYAEEGSNLDKAQALIERALEIDPENGAYLDSLGWVFFKKGQLQEALQYLQEADNRLKDPVIYEHLGDVYYELNRSDEAKKFWRLSIELEPDQNQIVEKLNTLQ